MGSTRTRFASVIMVVALSAVMIASVSAGGCASDQDTCKESGVFDIYPDLCCQKASEVCEDRGQFKALCRNTRTKLTRYYYQGDVLSGRRLLAKPKQSDPPHGTSAFRTGLVNFLSVHTPDSHSSYTIPEIISALDSQIVHFTLLSNCTATKRREAESDAMKAFLKPGREMSAFLTVPQDMIHGMDSITCKGKVIPASKFSFLTDNSTETTKPNSITALDFCPITGRNDLHLHLKIKSTFDVTKKIKGGDKRRKELLASLVGAEIHVLSGKSKETLLIPGGSSKGNFMAAAIGNSS